MPESVPCAFGWINPLLGQMASSPCRAEKRRQLVAPSWISVRVVMCFTPKKLAGECRTSWLLGSVLVMEYDSRLRICKPPPCVCARTRACVCVLKFTREGMTRVSSWKMWTSRSARRPSAFVVRFGEMPLKSLLSGSATAARFPRLHMIWS